MPSIKSKKQTCWEYLNEIMDKEMCTEQERKKCPVCIIECDEDCWLTAPKKCLEIIKIDNCWDCPWFKKNNPHFPDKLGTK